MALCMLRGNNSQVGGDCEATLLVVSFASP